MDSADRSPLRLGCCMGCQPSQVVVHNFQCELQKGSLGERRWTRYIQRLDLPSESSGQVPFEPTKETPV